MHLAVALDGAGWHPAAWRHPSARPAELFTARYWADLARTAERGLLDLLTIEDAFGLQSARYAGPDERTDQVRGRLDAALIASFLAPADHAHRARAHGEHHAHRAVPRRLGDLHARLRQPRPGRAGGRRSR